VMASASSVRRAKVVDDVLGRFCSAEGLGGPGLSHALIEAFVGLGLPGRAPSTKGTYRSVLRQRAPGRPPLGQRFAPSPAMAPYGAGDVAELFSLAASQKSAWRRSSAMSFLALGVGAGLRPVELAATTADDVTSGRGSVTVRVGAGAGRAVPVSGFYAEVLARQAGQVGAGHLFCPGGADRHYKNFVNNFCYKLSTSPGSPRFCSGRARSTFICSHLGAGTSLRELLYIAGIAEVESLLRYARLVPGAPASKAGLRRGLCQG
jgi:integrase